MRVFLTSCVCYLIPSLPLPFSDWFAYIWELSSSWVYVLPQFLVRDSSEYTRYPCSHLCSSHHLDCQLSVRRFLKLLSQKSLCGLDLVIWAFPFSNVARWMSYDFPALHYVVSINWAQTQTDPGFCCKSSLAFKHCERSFNFASWGWSSGGLKSLLAQPGQTQSTSLRTTPCALAAYDHLSVPSSCFEFKSNKLR